MTKLFHKNKAVKFITPILNLCKNRNSTINNFIEAKRDYHISKLDMIHNKFYKVLFEQIVSCSLIDTYDFFSNHNQTTDILFRNTRSPEVPYLEKFEKHMIMYHVVKFLQKNSHEVDVTEINKIILTKFDFKSADKDRFGKYFNRSQNMNDKFENSFAKEICQNVFNMDNVNDELSFYMSDFLTQCHESFMNSYTTYVYLETNTNLLKNKA